MNYYTNLYSPETYRALVGTDKDVSGFSIRQRQVAERLRLGDMLICYMTRLSRWFGVLEVASEVYIDETPIFVPENDPYIVRLKVKPHVWLNLEHAIPIHDEMVWKALSFTRDLEEGSMAWTGKVRGSLTRLDEGDGRMLVDLLSEQKQRPRIYQLDEADQKKLAVHVVNRVDKTVAVSVPEDGNGSEPSEPEAQDLGRESIRVQAALARIGAQMNMKIWIPKSDRGLVQAEWPDLTEHLLGQLPLNYDDTTLRTIEQIDVLWMRGRSIVRAFEVEHTTAVYSGILRMADLLALQPNMNIKVHIVAPEERREKVFQQIMRPVFSLLEKGPLAESCTFLTYDSVYEIARQRHLSHLNDSVLDEYAEAAE